MSATCLDLGERLKHPTFWRNRLDWMSYGYTYQAAPAKEDVPPMWHTLESIVDQAKFGDFSRVHEVLEMYRHLKDQWVLKRTCIEVLGDVGSPQIFRDMMEELDRVFDPDLSLHYCSAFAQWGHLSAISAIIMEYRKYSEFQDFEVVPLFVSQLLEPSWGDFSEQPKSDEAFEAYADRVMRRQYELEEQLGADTLVFHGERFGVVPLAKLALDRLGASPFERTFQGKFRRKFEAATGIDCTVFFKDGSFQAKRARRVIETFLANPDVERFRDGDRYFFGHPLPR